MPPLVREAFLGALMIGAFAASPGARADTVTIYRCVDAKGGVSLQDRACPKDARQEVREMLRPQDAPPQPVAVARYAPPPRPVEMRIVHARDPLPVYQCTTQDGDTYINHTGIPQGRYVPLWTTGLGRGSGFVGRGRAPPPTAAFAGAAMTYVEDTCVRLPQEDVCADLRARDDRLETLIFNAQPNARERYEHERKGLAGQMRSDCSGN